MKLNPEKVYFIKQQLWQGADVCSLAMKFDVSLSLISAIRNGKCWRHIQYMPEGRFA